MDVTHMKIEHQSRQFDYTSSRVQYVQFRVRDERICTASLNEWLLEVRKLGKTKLGIFITHFSYQMLQLCNMISKNWVCSAWLCPTWADNWHVNSLTIDQKSYIPSYLGHSSIFFLQIFRIIVEVQCTQLSVPKIWRTNNDIGIRQISSQNIFEDQNWKFGHTVVCKMHL